MEIPTNNKNNLDVISNDITPKNTQTANNELLTHNIDPTLSEDEYNRILLSNLGFQVDPDLLNNPHCNADLILTLGTQAIIGNRLDFAKQLSYVANNNGHHKVAHQLSKLITTKRDKK
ncbi:MAG: hypothetical protein KAS93_07375 [Gammaproteobacteria bacterium]|nr:hypothetical protein [Gammaproteobacteria bacterium]